MAGPEKDLLLKLYIPFCARKCGYCPLQVCAYDAGVVRAHGEAMLAEIEAAAEDGAGYVVRAVSIEGGSPCLTPADLLRDMLRTIRKHFRLAEDVQIGIQTMPGDYSRALVQRLADEEVNFWTVGLQTADPEEHRLLDRPYRFDALTMVDTAVRVFPMRALDFHLLYGIPGQTALSWERTLDKVLAYEPEHLTLEPLRLLPGTVLFARCAAGEVAPCSAEAAEELYERARKKLVARGYRQYTVHNFALPGHEDRCRLGLLRGTDRLGFGYQADSCIDGVCYTNGHSLAEYLAHPTELEVIANHVTRLEGPAPVLREAHAALELGEAVDPAALTAKYGQDAERLTSEVLPALLSDGCLERTGDGLRLTARGIAAGALYRLG